MYSRLNLPTYRKLGDLFKLPQNSKPCLVAQISLLPNVENSQIFSSVITDWAQDLWSMQAVKEEQNPTNTPLTKIGFNSRVKHMSPSSHPEIRDCSELYTGFSISATSLRWNQALIPFF